MELWMVELLIIYTIVLGILGVAFKVMHQGLVGGKNNATITITRVQAVDWLVLDRLLDATSIYTEEYFIANRDRLEQEYIDEYSLYTNDKLGTAVDIITGLENIRVV